MISRPTLQKLRRRSWENIIESWVSSSPTIDIVGGKPDPGVSNLELQIQDADPKQEDWRGATPPGLRANVLLESIYLAHKSGHLLRASEMHGRHGMNTWALVSAYHSAFVGAKSILGLQGVFLTEYKSRPVILDLFPEEERSRPRKRPQSISKLSGDFKADEVALIFYATNEAHRALWLIFERVLNITSSLPCSQNMLASLKSVDWQNVSRPRNHLIYRNKYWPYDDLHYPCSNIKFCRKHLRDIEKNGLSADDEDFLFMLALIIFHYCQLLLEDIGKELSAIKLEHDLLIGGERITENQYYFRMIS